MPVQHQTVIPNPLTTTIGFATLSEAFTVHKAIKPNCGIMANGVSRNYELTLTRKEVARYWEWYIPQAAAPTT